MALQKKQVLKNSLLGICAFYLFTVYIAFTFHKSEMVMISPSGAYASFFSGFAVNSLMGYISTFFDTILNAITLCLSALVKFSDILFSSTSAVKPFFKASTLLAAPYFILFLVILMLSPNIATHRIIMITIGSCTIINFTFFYTLVQTAEVSNATKVPLEQLSAYCIFNILLFALVYLIICKFFNRKEVEKS
ncbi:MAG TPA: hypothetical protein DIV86_04240 [Alphaproteobacteria bacterium]|nr:hypothetical protein [Alphaproteobacteria bacterium]